LVNAPARIALRAICGAFGLRLKHFVEIFEQTLRKRDASGFNVEPTATKRADGRGPAAGFTGSELAANR
jgi:hypothetical protein